MSDSFEKNYCFHDNKDFLRLKNGAALLFIRRAYDSAALRDSLLQPERYLSSAQLVKDSRTTKAGFITLDNGEKVFIKKYNNKGLKYTLKYLLRKSRAAKAFMNAWNFENLHIPTPAALGAVTFRPTGIIKNSYIIYKTISGVTDTLDFFRMTRTDENLLENFIRYISKYMSIIHNNGIIHGDLKLSNIYHIKDSGTFGLWDLDGVKYFKGQAPFSARVEEIARVVSSYIEIGSRLDVAVDREPVAECFKSAYEEHSKVAIDKNSLLNSIDKFLGKRKR